MGYRNRCGDRGQRSDSGPRATAPAADAIRLSHRTPSTIKGNLAWAFGYTVAALLAAAGLLNPNDRRSGDGAQLGFRGRM